MEKLYSLVIHPPDDILILVKTMKEQLTAEVGWYNSKNSIGHITICELKATKTAIASIKKQIIKLCDSFQTKSKPVLVFTSQNIILFRYNFKKTGNNFMF
jgi:hypothetical protein